MHEHRISSLLSLVRQGIALEVGFGTRSLEALVDLAETVEQSVYAAGSLVRTETGLAFLLANPPLRVGAFRALRASVNAQVVAPDRLRFRPGAGTAWRTAATLGPERPLLLEPGRATELDLGGVEVPPSGRARVRLELESVAIPPLVWVEFDDEVGSPRG